MSAMRLVGHVLMDIVRFNLRGRPFCFIALGGFWKLAIGLQVIWITSMGLVLTIGSLISGLHLLEKILKT